MLRHRVLHLYWLASSETVNLGLAGDMPAPDNLTAPDFGSEVGPWVRFERRSGAPLMRVY